MTTAACVSRDLVSTQHCGGISAGSGRTGSVVVLVVDVTAMVEVSLVWRSHAPKPAPGVGNIPGQRAPAGRCHPTGEAASLGTTPDQAILGHWLYGPPPGGTGVPVRRSKLGGENGVARTTGERRLCTQEKLQAVAQVHYGGGTADGGIEKPLSGHLGRFVPRHLEEAQQCPSQEGCKELEAGAILATVVQGRALQYLRRVRANGGMGFPQEEPRSPPQQARHLDVRLREGLPAETFQKRLLGLAGAASTPWGRVIRSSPQLRGVLSQDWALLVSGSVVEYTCPLLRPSEEQATFQQQLSCPFTEGVHRVFLHIRARESANVRRPPPPDIGDLLRDPELPASLREWIVSSR
ncbi:hypothetical protein CYMTET_22716 [Cymbomonas tetramitiformis]|uniref:Uncharacterized protein n=1 Tax=Cymbomonas tetramitiformis TaxID=36881 RepID=A0AAE0FZP0_9CHLO|nr:hypothetical protein CYMTET_22716 [Cymbomonas tetramitiformis]